MTNNPTIDGVSRATIEAIIGDMGTKAYVDAWKELSALLDADHTGDPDAMVAPAGGLQEPEVPVVGRLVPNGGGYDCWHPKANQGQPVILQSDHAECVDALQSTIAQLEDKLSKAINLDCQRRETIARLEAEAQYAAATHQAAIDRIAELESGMGEPVAHIVEVVDPNSGNLRRRGLHWHSVETLRDTRDFNEWIGENVTREQPLYTAPPAPFAVVLPERKVNSDREWDSHHTAEVKGWNACLEATAALNGPAK